MSKWTTSCPTPSTIRYLTGVRHVITLGMFQIGTLSKSSVMTREQKMILKNIKAKPVLLTVVESVPKSTDEKIKVRTLLSF